MLALDRAAALGPVVARVCAEEALAGTNVAGLEIFYRAFLYLKFGPATAMAWMLGFLLILFTMVQLRMLSRVEFKASGGKD